MQARLGAVPRETARPELARPGAGLRRQEQEQRPLAQLLELLLPLELLLLPEPLLPLQAPPRAASLPPAWVKQRPT